MPREFSNSTQNTSLPLGGRQTNRGTRPENTVNSQNAPPNATGNETQIRPETTEQREMNTHTPTKRRANICIAMLNMNGAAAPSERMDHIDKWSTVNSMIRNNKIAILALQETHLDQNKLDDVKRCFGRNLDIHNSSNPNNLRGIAGVAIVLNKVLIAPKKIRFSILIEGRTIMIRINWSETEEVTIVNIYAPTNRQLQPPFWTQLDTERRRKRLPKPDFLLGDFNVTEEAIDCSPPKDNKRAVVEALRALRITWNVQDQWHHDNPNGRIFTHSHTNGRKHEHARLDRIYTAKKHDCWLFEWKANQLEVPTDHSVVSVKFAPKDAPLIGNGRWRHQENRNFLKVALSCLKLS